jgi:hypothetical protein
MKRRPADTSDSPVRERGRLGRSLPVLAGSVIAAVGLAFGSLTAVSAAAGHGGHPSIEQQAAKVRAEDAFTPRNGNTELNINVLEDQVKHYYGSASATFPAVGTVTVPSSSSNYASQMKHIVAGAEHRHPAQLQLAIFGRERLDAGVMFPPARGQWGGGRMPAAPA